MESDLAIGEKYLRRKEYVKFFKREFGISSFTVDRWIKGRVVPSIKIGGITFVDPAKARAALQRFERGSVSGAAQPKVKPKSPKR